MWQCFLRSSTNNIRYRYEHGGSIEDTGVDGARLQCCNKAITFRCRDLCIKVPASITFHYQYRYGFTVSISGSVLLSFFLGGGDNTVLISRVSVFQDEPFTQGTA